MGKAFAKAMLTMMYEEKICARYSRRTLRARQFVDATGATRTADTVAVIDGRDIPVEAKFTDDWASSIYNPKSGVGPKGFAQDAQQEMIDQARRCINAFGEAIYHSNSKELIDHYTRIFQQNGISNVRFILTNP